MTREFNKHERYDSRPPYRGTSSNKQRYEAEQPPQGARPRLNRAMVDRAWENGAPHRHADYKPRYPNQPGRNQSNYGPDARRSGAPREQSFDQASSNQSFQNRDDGKRYSRPQTHNQQNPAPRADASTNRFSGPRPRSGPPNQAMNERPPYRDQEQHRNTGNSSRENTYNARNGHPNFSQRDQRTPQGRGGYQGAERERYENPRNNARPYREGPNNYDRQPDRRHTTPNRPYDQRDRGDARGPEARGPRPRQFEGHEFERPQWQEERQEHSPRYPRYPANPEHRRDPRPERRFEQFEGDYEQFDHAPGRQPREEKWQKPQRPGPGRFSQDRRPAPFTQERHAPVEQERHVTQLPDGRVLKGPRPAQRKNAQFWTDISQNTEQLVKQVNVPEKVPVEQEPTDTEASEQSAESTPRRIISPRAKAAKRAASVARKHKSDKPVSKGPRPSQRGFKWPVPPAQTGE